MSGMAEIPERYRKSYEDGPGWVQPVYEELGAAEARIRELEQERGAEGTNWFPESFVAQLQEQLREATERCDHFCKMALVPDGTESRKERIALQAQLQAVTQERDRLLIATRVLKDEYSIPAKR